MRDKSNVIDWKLSAVKRVVGGLLEKKVPSLKERPPQIERVGDDYVISCFDLGTRISRDIFQDIGISRDEVGKTVTEAQYVMDIAVPQDIRAQIEAEGSEHIKRYGAQEGQSLFETGLRSRLSRHAPLPPSGISLHSNPAVVDDFDKSVTMEPVLGRYDIKMESLKEKSFTFGNRQYGASYRVVFTPKFWNDGTLEHYASRGVIGSLLTLDPEQVVSMHRDPTLKEVDHLLKKEKFTRFTIKADMLDAAVEQSGGLREKVRRRLHGWRRGE